MIFYLVLAHNNLDQLELLVKKLKSKNSEIFVHIDKKVKNFTKIKNIHYVKDRKKILRWWFAMVEAEIAGFRQIFPSMSPWDHVVIISWQCFPVKPVNQIERYISDLWNKSCIYYNSVPNKTKWKVEKYHFLDVDFHMPKWFDKFVYTIVDLFYKKLWKPHRVPVLNGFLYVLMNLILPKRKFLTKKYAIYHWSSRMVLSYWVIKWVLDFLDSDEWKDVFRHFKMTANPDEVFFQTILLNNKIEGVINETLWYQIREGKYNNSPRILTIDDYDNILKSNKLFGRKFDLRTDKNIINYLLNL